MSVTKINLHLDPPKENPNNLMSTLSFVCYVELGAYKVSYIHTIFSYHSEHVWCRGYEQLVSLWALYRARTTAC